MSPRVITIGFGRLLSMLFLHCFLHSSLSVHLFWSKMLFAFLRFSVKKLTSHFRYKALNSSRCPNAKEVLAKAI